jgi:hypothetical protein
MYEKSLIEVSCRRIGEAGDSQGGMLNRHGQCPRFVAFAVSNLSSLSHNLGAVPARPPIQRSFTVPCHACASPGDRLVELLIY